MLCLLIQQDEAERMTVLHEQITIREYLEDSWSTWFDGLTITHAADRPRRSQDRLAIRAACTTYLGVTQADAPDIQRLSRDTQL